MTRNIEQFVTVIHSLREPRDEVRALICTIIKHKIIESQLSTQFAEWAPLSVTLPVSTRSGRTDDCRGLSFILLGEFDLTFFMVGRLINDSALYQQIRLGSVLLKVNGRNIRGCGMQELSSLMHHEDECQLEFAQPRELADITKLLQQYDHAKRVIGTMARPEIDKWKHVSYTLEREHAMSPMGLGLMVMKKSPCVIVDELIPGTPAAACERQIRMCSQLLLIDGQVPHHGLEAIRKQFKGSGTTIELREPPDVHELYRLCCCDTAYLTSISPTHSSS
jgi:hypothetical protein